MEKEKQTKEEWKDVIGFEDYFMVSDHGNVWSKRTKKFLIPVKSKTGYLTIPTKIGGRRGENYCFRVHRMVAEAFIPNPDEKPFINHIDGDKTNNYVSNLEWCTKQENAQHALKTGLLNSFVKLTEDQVKEIRYEYNKNITITELSKQYCVDRKTIKDIINYKIWKHV